MCEPAYSSYSNIYHIVLLKAWLPNVLPGYRAFFACLGAPAGSFSGRRHIPMEKDLPAGHERVGMGWKGAWQACMMRVRSGNRAGSLVKC